MLPHNCATLPFKTNLKGNCMALQGIGDFFLFYRSMHPANQKKQQNFIGQHNRLHKRIWHECPFNLPPGVSATHEVPGKRRILAPDALQ